MRQRYNNYYRDLPSPTRPRVVYDGFSANLTSRCRRLRGSRYPAHGIYYYDINKQKIKINSYINVIKNNDRAVTDRS